MTFLEKLKSQPKRQDQVPKVPKVAPPPPFGTNGTELLGAKAPTCLSYGTNGTRSERVPRDIALKNYLSMLASCESEPPNPWAWARQRCQPHLFKAPPCRASAWGAWWEARGCLP